MTMTFSDAGVTFPDTSVQAKSAQGPAFSVYQNSSQSLSNSTFTKISFQAKEFDTANYFDAVTNYRFQPLVAGYYQINYGVTLGSSLTGERAILLYKNGASYKNGQDINGSTGYGLSGSCLVYLNGSTDYVEVFALQVTGGAVSTAATAAQTYFQGYLARAA